ncbi:membrane protein [Oceanicola sp. 22II-s10i]|uniref:DUF2306 domain-containing protein n=1 Tax=Oceanicola sp. 22II-s10i TaxID=1317116 RepID=UPI000B51EDB6|nr:DUF2306 domain-containing protein [Oceanicola sp. 22II-s10i]OWU85465.1 membrane protein [Oceanicola sp. 22II-s10i]
MSLAPLLHASPVIQIHAFSAILLVPLTVLLLAARKGTPLHRVSGRIWAGGMALVALSSFGIHTIRMVGPFSPIHLLSIFTLASLAVAVLAARRGHVRQHRRAMRMLVFGALLGAGAFTVLPGRLMFEVVAGG